MNNLQVLHQFQMIYYMLYSLQRAAASDQGRNLILTAFAHSHTFNAARNCQAQVLKTHLYT